MTPKFLQSNKTSWAWVLLNCGLDFDEILKSNQGNQDSSGNKKNVIQGERPDMENTHTQQRT